jgi:hypothetical protein
MPFQSFQIQNVMISAQTLWTTIQLTLKPEGHAFHKPFPFRLTSGRDHTSTVDGNEVLNLTLNTTVVSPVCRTRKSDSFSEGWYSANYYCSSWPVYGMSISISHPYDTEWSRTWIRITFGTSYFIHVRTDCLKKVGNLIINMGGHIAFGGFVSLLSIFSTEAVCS